MTSVEDTSVPNPPRGVGRMVQRGLRALAAAAVALIVAAVAAAAEGRDGPRTWMLGVAAGLLLTIGLVLSARGRWRTASATSAVVAAVVLATLAVRSALGTPHLPTFLGFAGAAALVAGLATDERRLTALGTGQWALALALPPAGATAFRHCLVATDLAVPLPRLDGPLLLGLGALAVGTGLRWYGLRPRAARGVEVTGVLLALAVLVAKGAELPGLPILCGSGDAVDGGWMALALGAGMVAGVYGVLTRDLLWAGAGTATVVLAGLVATMLGGGAGWAVAALVPVATVVVLAERRGVPWPDEPGYRHRRPGPARSGTTGGSGDA